MDWSLRLGFSSRPKLQTFSVQLLREKYTALSNFLDGLSALG